MILDNKITSTSQLVLGKLFFYGPVMVDSFFIAETYAQIVAIENVDFGQFRTTIYHLNLFDKKFNFVKRDAEQEVVMETRIDKEHFYDVLFESEDEEAKFCLVRR